MIRKFLAISLMILILCSSSFINPLHANAYFPIAVKVSSRVLAAILNLAAAGVTFSSADSAKDIGTLFDNSMMSFPTFDPNGKNLVVDIASINAANDWINEYIDYLPDTITGEDGTPYMVGTDVAGDPTPNTTEDPGPFRYYFENRNFPVSWQELHIVNFGGVTRWIAHPDYGTSSRSGRFKLEDVDTGAWYQLTIGEDYARVDTSTGFFQSIPIPYSYIGMIYDSKFVVNTQNDLLNPGKKSVNIQWRYFDNDYYNWSISDHSPICSFDNSNGNISFAMAAASYDSTSVQVHDCYSYPKTDITIGPKLREPITFPVVPNDWDKIIHKTAPEIAEDSTTEPPVEEPLPTDELGFLSTISTKITNVIDTITSLPENVANAISNKFTTVNPGDSIDFTKLRVAGNLFTNKFPFCLPWDLKNMISTFGVGTTVAPTIPIALGTITSDINLSRFDSIAAAARVLELFVFNIGLIFGTRKLMGGGS